jgi:Glutamine amidotransferase domain
MPARVAALFSDDDAGAARVEALLRLPVEGVSARIDVTAVTGGWIAAAEPSIGRSRTPLVRVGSSGRRLWIVGMPVALDGSLESRLASVMEDELPAAVEGLTRVDGAFSALLWEPATAQLIVVTDFAGMQPLYMRRTDKMLAFATSFCALASLPPKAGPDGAGWGAFVALGHLVGDPTTVEGTTRVEGARVLVYTPATQALSSRCYWRWPEINHGVTANRIDTAGLLSILHAHLDAYSAHATGATLLLSGGFESRLLAGMLVERGCRPRVLNLCNPYEHHEVDGRLARRVAGALALPIESVTPDAGFFSSAQFADYVRLNEAATTSVNLFIAQVCSEIVRRRATAIWDGVGYGVVIKDKSAPSLAAYLSRAVKAPDSVTWRAAARVFAPAFVDAMRSGLRETLQIETTRCADGPGGVAQFFVRNRVRNRTSPNATKVFAQFVLPFLPGFSKMFYDTVATIPPPLKTDNRLYRLILDRHFPALARLPTSSGGTLQPGTRTEWTYRWLAARSAVVEHPRVGHWLRRIGITPMRRPSSLVSQAVADATPDDPYLNADRIRQLQATEPTAAVEDGIARELVFYWSAYRSMTS